MDRSLVADAGPVIHLTQADAISLLERIGSLTIPEAVLDELARGSVDLSAIDYSAVAVAVDLDTAYPISIPARQLHLHTASNVAGYS